MPTIDTAFSLGDAVNAAGIAGVISKIHHGPWLSQPIQNRFYVLYNTPVGGLIGYWYAESQIIPTGASVPGTFFSPVAIGQALLVVSPYGALMNTTCLGLHYGPMYTAAIEVTYMIVYDTPQPFGTGRFYTLDELTV